MLFKEEILQTSFDETKKLWSGLRIPTILNPNVSLGHSLLKAMNVNAVKVAQINDDNNYRMTFGEMYTKTIRAAQNLQRLGYERKDIFSFVVDNNHNVAPIVFASYCLGCPVSPLSTAFAKTEFIHTLKVTTPKLMFCEVKIYDLVRECLRELKNEAKIFTFGGQSGDSIPVEELFNETGYETKFIPVDLDGSTDIATINWSSGTTGLPKGVCTSHADFLDQVNRMQLIKSDEVILCFSTIHWTTAIYFQLIGTIFGSIRILTIDPFTPELLFKLIEKYRVTYILNGCHQVMRAVKSKTIDNADMSSVKYYVGCGGKVSPNATVKMNSCIPYGAFVGGYGTTETGPIAGGFEFCENLSGGKLFSGSEVKIVDENGERLGIGEDGEICVKRLYNFLGYFGDKKSSDDAIDGEGFVLTGDIGHFDEDGDLYVVDRKKDIIKYTNFVISPCEIEGFLNDCPGILEACIVGVPDEVFVDLPAAVVVLSANSMLSEKEIYDLVADKFADHKKLRGGVNFVIELPRTPSGKIVRSLVKEIAVKNFVSK